MGEQRKSRGSLWKSRGRRKTDAQNANRLSLRKCDGATAVLALCRLALREIFTWTLYFSTFNNIYGCTYVYKIHKIHIVYTYIYACVSVGGGREGKILAFKLNGF